jgi:hypothetical protein
MPRERGSAFAWRQGGYGFYGSYHVYILLGEFAFHGIMYKVVARLSGLQEVCRNNHQTTISIDVALKVTCIDA